MSLMARSLRIVLAGSIAAVPGHGGWTWALLQYVLGLRQLGHEVCWIDPICADALVPEGVPFTDSRNAAYFRQVAARFGVSECSTLLLQGASPDTIGRPLHALLDIVSEADLLINVSGVLRDTSLLGTARRRVYLDLDPGYTQLWQVVDAVDMRLDAHTDFVTIGPALPGGSIPTLGRHWIATLQPVVLSEWPGMEAAAVERDAFTTVANWRGYGSISFGGAFYGQKAHSFRQFFGLPSLADERFELALSIHPDEARDLDALRATGWRLLDPAVVAGTPDTYRRFVQGSRAELAIAKSGYVVGPTGWFSDRSICYLASGRPVAAQDTGFADYVPTGCGLLAFGDIEEAADAVRRIRCDYALHARAARAIAEECFESDYVLSRLLQQLGAAA